jgi:cytochrome P450
MPPPDRPIADLSALLQQSTTLDQIGAEILREGGPGAIRYRETGASGTSMVFVARHDDVARVLKCEAEFSLYHYNPLYSAIAPPGAFIVMRPEGPERAQRMAILKAAAATTPWFGLDRGPRRDLTRECVNTVLTAVRGRRRFDLIGEYAFFVPYLVGERVLGFAGPRSFSLLPLLVCLLNRRSPLQLFRPETGPYLTGLAWSEFPGAQLLTNFENRNWLIRTLARWGASRLRNQTERHVDAAPKAARDGTLLSALWAVREDFKDVEDVVYREHVVSIMIELGGTLLLFPGLGFTEIIQRWLGPGGPGLEASLRRLDTMRSQGEAEDFVQEQLRLAPPSSLLLRNATQSVNLGGLTLEAGEYVCALVRSAGTDVSNPQDVEAGRCPKTYLHFGPEGGPHQCFSHLFTPTVLAEIFLGLTRLNGLEPRSGLTAYKGMVPGRLMVEFGELARRAS